MIFELEQVQTSYNLPTFPPLPPRPSPRRRPIPLPLLAGPKLIPLPPDPQPLNTQPASIQQPTTSNWTPRKAYRRSPLGPPYLGERGPPISRRYIRPPPPNSIVQCQAFHTPRLGEDSVFEDWVARALQRRIGEKVAKARRVGDKLGMGVNAGREMRIWAHLSGLEKLKREAATPASAPATQITFTTAEDLRGQTTDARLARSLGHRKTMSLTAFPASPRPARTMPSLDKLNRLRDFVTGATRPSTSVAVEAEMMRRIVQEHLDETRAVEEFAEEIRSEFEDASESSEEEEEGDDVELVRVDRQLRSHSPTPIDIHLDETTQTSPADIEHTPPQYFDLSCLSPPPESSRSRSRSRSPPEQPSAKRPAMLQRLNSDQPIPSVRPPPPARLPSSPGSAPGFLLRPSASLDSPRITGRTFVSRLPPPSASPPRQPLVKGSRYDLPRQAMPVATARPTSAIRSSVGVEDEQQGRAWSAPKLGRMWSW